MLRALAKLNEELAVEGRAPLQIGIGLHYGQMVMGMVGIQGRMDATVIGDAVNVASRIEDSTRAYGLPLLLTAQVCNRLEFLTASLYARSIACAWSAAKSQLLCLNRSTPTRPPSD